MGQATGWCRSRSRRHSDLRLLPYTNRRIVPNLAEAWTNPDPLTWRIKLREGVQWQKGYGELTAADVVYCWNYHLENRSWLVASVLLPLDTVKAEGKYVVEVKTKAPFGPLPGATMVYGGRIVSAKAHREMGNAAYSAAPVGMGPHRVESKRGTEIILSKHPGYWQPGFPKLDRIVYRAIPERPRRRTKTHHLHRITRLGRGQSVMPVV